MDRYRAMRLASALLMAGGFLLLAWAALQGQVSFAFVLIIPVIYGAGPLAALSMLMVFAGVMLLFLSLFKSTVRMDALAAPETAKKEWGGVILIGPVPIVIGSAGMLKRRGPLILLAILSTVLLVFFLLMFLR